MAWLFGCMEAKMNKKLLAGLPSSEGIKTAIEAQIVDKTPIRCTRE